MYISPETVSKSCPSTFLYPQLSTTGIINSMGIEAFSLGMTKNRNIDIPSNRCAIVGGYGTARFVSENSTIDPITITPFRDFDDAAKYYRGLNKETKEIGRTTMAQLTPKASDIPSYDDYINIHGTGPSGISGISGTSGLPGICDDTKPKVRTETKEKDYNIVTKYLMKDYDNNTIELSEDEYGIIKYSNDYYSDEIEKMDKSGDFIRNITTIILSLLTLIAPFTFESPYGLLFGIPLVLKGLVFDRFYGKKRDNILVKKINISYEQIREYK